MKSNLSEILSELIASLSMILLLQFNLTNLKLDFLKSDFKCKTGKCINKKIIFASLKFDFFRVQLKFAFRMRT